MKRRILLLIIAIPLSVFSQYEPGMQQLFYENNHGEKGISTYIYNGRHLPYKAIWMLTDTSRWSVNYNEFDEHGNMIKRYREFSDSIITKQNYLYDNQDHLIYESFWRSDSVKGEVFYTYDNGLLQSADCRGLNGWFSGRIDYQCNSDGKLVSANLTMQDKKAGQIDFTYDAYQRLKEETWTFDQGFTQTFTYTYLDTRCVRYRSSNVFIAPGCRYRVKEENYDFSGETGGPSYYTYDETGKLVKKVFVRNDGLKTETSYTYQPNGCLLSSHRSYADGRKGAFSYTYDEFGQLIERHFLCSDGKKIAEYYSYDGHGRLIRARYENFDGWLTGKLSFSHDMFDRIESANYQADKGPNAHLSFSYSTEGLLKKIHWQFESGHSQTYTFEWEEIL